MSHCFLKIVCVSSGGGSVHLPRAHGQPEFPRGREVESTAHPAGLRGTKHWCVRACVCVREKDRKRASPCK